MLRYSLNWIKLRAWELTEWDAVLLVDSDVTLLGDLSHLFTLPTPFAAVPDQDEISPTWWFGGLGRVQGGMLFLRPCKAVAEHMIALARSDRLLQFQYDYAEQVRPRTSCALRSPCACAVAAERSFHTFPVMLI